MDPARLLSGFARFGELCRESHAYLLGTAPLSNSWIIIIWLYIALNRTPNIDCYWVGAVPNIFAGRSLALSHESRAPPAKPNPKSYILSLKL